VERARPRIERVDHAFDAFAERVVSSYLTLRRGERLLLLIDRANLDLGQVLDKAATGIGASVTTLVFEDLGPRPMARVHPRIIEEVAKCDAALLSLEVIEGEMPTRRLLWTQLGSDARIRYVHATSTARDKLIEGALVDPRRIAELGTAIRARIRSRSTIRVTSKAGTDLTVVLSDRYLWKSDNGVAFPGKGTQLPAGELSTHPETANGVYVVDGGVMNTADGEMAGAGAVGAIRLEFKGGRVVGIRSPAYGAKLELAIRHMPDLDRIGLLCFGTNTGLLSSCGHFNVDQKMPGAHVVLGGTFREFTRATWSAAGLIGTTCVNSDIDLDGAPLLRSGRYLV
jgi:leucyl aminopeptidase (aminopeptidase T)